MTNMVHRIYVVQYMLALGFDDLKRPVYGEIRNDAGHSRVIEEVTCSQLLKITRTKRVSFRGRNPLVSNCAELVLRTVELFFFSFHLC